MRSTNRPTFEDLRRAHQALGELLLAVQEALVERSVIRAAALWNELLAAQERHVADEEELLIPLLERGEEIPGASAAMLCAEHAKILRLARELGEELERAIGEGLTPRRVVRLIDEQGVLKRLLEHHEQREESLLFPALDAVTDERERATLLRRCWMPNEAAPAS